jgi:hypothetical protein
MSADGMVSSDQPLPTADVWLVHTAPGRAEDSAHVNASVSGVARALTFPETRIQTPLGVFTIEIQCFVEAGETSGGEQLFVSANRRVRFTAASGAVRDLRPVFEGSLKTAVPFPKPADVLAFELPSVQVPGAPAIPDRFTLRVRVTPGEQ